MADAALTPPRGLAQALASARGRGPQGGVSAMLLSLAVPLVGTGSQTTAAELATEVGYRPFGKAQELRHPQPTGAVGIQDCGQRT